MLTQSEAQQVARLYEADAILDGTSEFGFIFRSPSTTRLVFVSPETGMPGTLGVMTGADRSSLRVREYVRRDPDAFPES